MGHFDISEVGCSGQLHLNFMENKAKIYWKVVALSNRFLGREEELYDF